MEAAGQDHPSIASSVKLRGAYQQLATLFVPVLGLKIK